MFKQAEKKNLKLRMALCAPAGAGKTYSALSVATALGGKIAVVDTEHGSASKYADIFKFDVVEPDVFDPRELIETIRYAEKNGYAHIIIDSLSHYWSGKGGELDMVDAAAARSKSANTFMAWKTVTPVHNELIDTIISCKINVFVTMRTKTEYVIETNAAGKQVPRKVGLAPVMRDGIEYEFDVVGDMDQDNNFVVTKSRCPELSNKVINRPGKQIAETLIKWLNSGVSREDPPIKPATNEPRQLRPENQQNTPKVTEKPQTLAEKCGFNGGKAPQPELFPPEEEAAPVNPQQNPAHTAIPANTASQKAPAAEKNAGQVKAEIQLVRQLAKEYGCKTSSDFMELMQVIVERSVATAAGLKDEERAKVIEFLSVANEETQAQKEAA